MASVKEVEWDVEIQDTLVEGEITEIEIRITNTGNTIVSTRLLATVTSEWDLS